ncbi:glutamine amidotransferase [Brachybacterium ginsengisoli]|uniref:Glutamine amidotransferase n=1 Tax=Brachybacterium ginsengisoli TaxID=1331682 RepID=A0A291GTE6_9MICO|nr:glutamine amidotransferase [Brachybacterium ginsengisoli]ATG53491.1 glutamine amidotransferase [Brachybacterium ginsengisoli]
MKPFVQIATRPEDDVALTERTAVLEFTGLAEDELIWARLDRDPFPDLRPEDISGIILCGSPFTVSDPAEEKSDAQVRAEREIFRVLDEVIAHDVPFLGACYGIGTLGTHQGALIDRTYGEPLSAVEVTLTVDGAEDPLIRAADLPETFTGLVGHKEAVHTLPDHATLLASGSGSPVQMFRVGTRQYATQFHPELDIPSIIERARAYRDHGYFSPDEMEDVFDALRDRSADLPPRLLRAFATLFAR